jgi:hypothetical protein
VTVESPTSALTGRKRLSDAMQSASQPAAVVAAASKRAAVVCRGWHGRSPLLDSDMSAGQHGVGGCNAGRSLGAVAGTRTGRPGRTGMLPYLCKMELLWSPILTSVRVMCSL